MTQPPDINPAPAPTGTVAPQTNTPVQVATSILTTIIEKGIVQGLLEPYCISVCPLLGFPVINQIFDFTLDSEGSYIAKNLSTLLAIGIITIQVNQENSAFGKSWAALIQAITAGIPTDIDSATTNLENDFNNLVTWDGS